MDFVDLMSAHTATPECNNKCEVLVRLDAIQTRFLHDDGIDELTALMVFNLAPLAMRWDIAMLGMLHKAGLGAGPPHLIALFAGWEATCWKICTMEGASSHWSSGVHAALFQSMTLSAAAPRASCKYPYLHCPKKLGPTPKIGKLKMT